jgi:protein-tyrosine-phosphatase
MAEGGIGIAHHRSKSVEQLVSKQLDYVTTACDCARESCPVRPNRTDLIYWSFDDPGAETDPVHRRGIFA